MKTIASFAGGKRYRLRLRSVHLARQSPRRGTSRLMLRCRATPLARAPPIPASQMTIGRKNADGWFFNRRTGNRLIHVNENESRMKHRVHLFQ
jgi:hypothetical protein